MYLYSIPELHKAVQTTDHYTNKNRPTDKQVLIDKCNWLIHSIVEGNRHNWELFNYKPVPLSNTILKSIIGRTEYLSVIDILQQLGYITVDHNYTSTSFINLYNSNRVSEGKKPLNLTPKSKTYSLTDKALNIGVTKVGILTARMRVKIRKYKIEKIKKYQSEPVHAKILNSITQVEFNHQHPKALEAFETNKDNTTDKGKYFRETYSELQDLNHLNTINELSQHDTFYYTQSKNVNRVFHYYGTIPKPYRESLKLKSGGNLSEIDLRNSQPLIIALNYLKDNEPNLNKSDDQELLNAVLGGEFYKSVANQALTNEDTDTHNLYTTDYSKFKAKVLGEGLYFNYIPDPDKVKPVERYLMELYPNFMEYIRTKKRTQGYKIISIEAQIIESSIFIDGLYNQLSTTDIAIPVHDSIIVPTEKEDYFLNKLILILGGVFNYLPENNIRSLFKITQY